MHVLGGVAHSHCCLLQTVIMRNKSKVEVCIGCSEFAAEFQALVDLVNAADTQGGALPLA